MDRFNLEDQISKIYNFSETLKDLSEGVLEYNLDKDDIVNALNGLSVMIHLHGEKMFDSMQQVFKLDQYRDIV